MEVEKLVSIPKHWQWIALGELTEVNPRFSRDDLKEDDLVSFVPMKRIEELSGVIDLSESQPLGEVKSGYTYFEDGDVLFAKITPCMENGKIAIASNLTNGVGFGSTEFHVIRHESELIQKWIFHFLIQEGFRRNAKRAMTGSAGQKRVPTDYLEDVPIPVPPRTEQARIISKIEELSSNLSVGLKNLQKAKCQVRRYRLSVVQAAIEGRLTAGWRRTHSPAETADELVRRVEEQDEVNKYKSRGKMAPLPDPPPFQIPNNWRWVRVGDIARRIRYGTSEKADREYRGPPVIRMGNIEGGRLQYDNLKFMPEDWEDEEKFLLEDGDVLFNRTNSAKLVGKTAVYKENHPRAVFASYLVRVRLYEDVCNPDLVAYYINSVHGRVYIREVTSQQVGQANVNATKLASMPFPLPPIAEQKQIAEEVERLLSIAHDAAATSESEVRRASKLRQSILRDAFSGKLLEKSA